MGNKIVKPSFYNILIKKEDGIAIFNTRTGKMARCFHGDAKIVEEHLSQKYIEWSHDNQYIVPMYKNGLLVDYNLDEISEMILKGDVHDGQTINVDIENNELKFNIE